MHVAVLSQRAQRNPDVLIVAIVTALTWTAFTLARPNIEIQLPCQFGAYYSRACTAASIKRQDPYCVVDPTCVSWVGYNSNAIYWQGLAIHGDPELIYNTPVALLSLPNFSLFVLIVVTLTGLSMLLLRDPRKRRVVFTVVATWYGLEVIRWFEALWRFSHQTSSLGSLPWDPETYLGLFLVMAPLWVTYRLAAPRLRLANHRT